MAVELINLAERMVYAGAATLLLEGVAAEVAQIITGRFDIPVISCGSGPACDGQILIAPDILGLTQGSLPKFSKSFGDAAKTNFDAFKTYCDQVAAAKFPDDKHSYHMKPGQLERLKEILDSKK
jgi:3-methyl-2-oxobutanoate hydroxymethyltransferase